MISIFINIYCHLCRFLIHCDTTSSVFYIKNTISIDRQQISTAKTTLRLLRRVNRDFTILGRQRDGQNKLLQINGS